MRSRYKPISSKLHAYRISDSVDHNFASFVPAHVPRKRRLQTLVVAIWSVMIPLSVVVFLVLWYVDLNPYKRLSLIHFTSISSFPQIWPLLVLYQLYIFVDKSPEQGGKTSHWFRSMRVWKYFADYYPASCVYSSPFSIPFADISGCRFIKVCIS
jgi:hypothetical protein